MLKALLTAWASFFWRAETTESAAVPGALLLVPELTMGRWWALEQFCRARVVPLVWSPPGAAVRPWPWMLGCGARVVRNRAEALREIRRTLDAKAVPCLVRGPLAEADVVDWARQGGYDVLPVEVVNLRRPALERAGIRPGGWEAGATFRTHAGKLLRSETIDADALTKAVLDIAAEALTAHPALERHLAEIVVRALKRKAFQPVVTDAYQNGKTLKGIMLLGAGWLLADWIRREIPERRVGIVLPPGLGAILANLGCLLADKVPVNLNFTSGRDANEKAIRAARLRHAITAEAFLAKVADFPWPEHRHDLTTVLTRIGKRAVILRSLRALFTPGGTLLRTLQIPRRGGDQEAGLLFTSGSSGDPKGVALSHRNLLANIAQIEAMLPGDRITSILGCLPVFHSFGFTVTLWWPLAGGPRVVTYVSPLETTKLSEIVHTYGVSLMVTTPTFLRSFLRKADPAQLKSLELVITGAEKLPTPLLQQFEEKFGVPVCEGYGMTEASPVISFNLTDELVRSARGRLPGRVIGTVGRPLPGISVRVKHPESGEDLPLSQTGMLWFKGANVFRGYLNEPARSAEVLKDGWYVSGDVGRLDPQGFLVIEGRLSRFSKIGGEMVPHGTVEAALLDILRGRIDGEFSLAVVGTRDAAKGEALVVLCTRPVDAELVRREMAAKGLPNLWIPRTFLQVEAVPVLASGKLDLRGCQNLLQRLLGGG
jgi:acyl-[acyl-carrier-protein]-phospholipid O-acyltransferase/long-chain-fatty-acid--[acyl-carrier-protein] ligase